MRLAGILALLLVAVLMHDQPVLIVACIVGVLALAVVDRLPWLTGNDGPPQPVPSGSVIEILGPEDDPEFLRGLNAQIQRDQSGEDNTG